jgi:hypothetical protein
MENDTYEPLSMNQRYFMMQRQNEMTIFGSRQLLNKKAYSWHKYFNGISVVTAFVC